MTTWQETFVPYPNALSHQSLMGGVVSITQGGGAPDLLVAAFDHRLKWSALLTAVIDSTELRGCARLIGCAFQSLVALTLENPSERLCSADRFARLMDAVKQVANRFTALCIGDASLAMDHQAKPQGVMPCRVSGVGLIHRDTLSCRAGEGNQAAADFSNIALLCRGFLGGSYFLKKPCITRTETGQTIAPLILNYGLVLTHLASVSKTRWRGHGRSLICTKIVSSGFSVSRRLLILEPA